LADPVPDELEIVSGIVIEWVSVPFVPVTDSW
jgi:hypothetical protein